VNYYQNDVGPFDTHLYGQAVHFVNSNSRMPEATRVHFEPTINLPLSNGWGSINTEAKLLATHYQQSNLDDYNAANGTDYKDSVNRVMPQFKVDGKMVFERDMQENYTQTLEPRMQYLYIPYRDQSKSAATTQRCCSRTTAACSATVPTAASTVSLPPTRSPPASHLAFMMPPPLNVLIFPLVKSTISPRHVPVMTTSTGRTTTREVHWYGLAIPTGASPMTGVYAGEFSTIRVWITSLPAAEPWNTVATKTV
jgi:LPS-assembly protein